MGILFAAAAVLGRCCPGRLPMHTRADVWRAMEIHGGNSSVLGSTDFRRSCFHNDREQGYAIFLDVDGVRTFVIAFGDTAANFIAAEFRFVRNVPFCFPPTIRRDGRAALADNAVAVA